MNTPARNRRILCVHLLDDYSGSAKVCAEVASILLADGYDVRVLVGSAGAPGFIRTMHRTTNFFYRTATSKPLLLLFLLAAQADLFIKTVASCVRLRPAAVYVSTLLPFAAVLGARAAGTPVIVHVHEVTGGSKLLFGLFDLVTRLLANRIVCVSRFVLSYLKYSEERSHVVYNSLSEDEWEHARRIAECRAHRPHTPFRVVMACSLKWYKGVDQFIELARTSLARGSKTEFVLILNCDRKQFDHYTARMCVANVTFAWRPPSVYAFYADADLLLNLTLPDGWTETFGLTLLEGMTCGLPVVAPPVGGCMELYDSGRGGWNINGRDIETLYSLVERLQSDPESWHTASLEARRAAERFAPTIFRREILSVFSGLRDSDLTG